MAAKSLDIHPSALAELKSSISWYLEQNEATADKFVEEIDREIDRAIDLVLASPRRWPTSDLDARKFVLRRFPYAVIYHERKSVVRVLAIAHGHRQPGYWKDRV
jgi:plasmid stabilization system protein ParE